MLTKYRISQQGPKEILLQFLNKLGNSDTETGTKMKQRCQILEKLWSVFELLQITDTGVLK